MRIKNESDFHALLGFFLVGVLLIYFLTACARGDLPPVPAPLPSPPPVDDLAAIAHQFVFWGAILAGLGLVFRIVSWFGVVPGIAGTLIKIITPFVGLSAWVGIASVVVGSGIHVVAKYPWTAAIILMLTFVARYLCLHPKLGGRLVDWVENHAKNLARGKK